MLVGTFCGGVWLLKKKGEGGGVDKYRKEAPVPASNRGGD